MQQWSSGVLAATLCKIIVDRNDNIRNCHWMQKSNFSYYVFLVYFVVIPHEGEGGGL